jgi:hypothetical protein
VTRYQSSSLQAMAEESLVAFRLLFDVGVTSGELHFVTGKHPTYYNGSTYTPVGGLGFVGPIQEDVEGVPRDITFGVSGVNTLALVGSFSLYEPLQEHMLNRPVRVFRQFLDPSNFTAVHTPEPHWTGVIADVSVDLKGGVYEVRALSDKRRTAIVRYFNRETFRRIDSSDTFGDHIDQIPLSKSNWGGRDSKFADAVRLPRTSEFFQNFVRGRR